MISGTIRNRIHFYWGRDYAYRRDRKLSIELIGPSDFFCSNGLTISWNWPRIRAEWIMPGLISATNEFSAYRWTGRRRELRFVPPVVRVSLIIGDRRWI